jgi:hypothetical protein
MSNHSRRQPQAPGRKRPADRHRPLRHRRLLAAGEGRDSRTAALIAASTADAERRGEGLGRSCLARAHLYYGGWLCRRDRRPTPAISFAPPTRCSPRWAWTHSRHSPPETEAAIRAFATDAADAEIHLLEGGHFLLESALDEVASLMRDFLARRLPETVAAGTAAGQAR